MNIPNINDLKTSGATPHYFGLGFIQLKLDDERRLHFWTPDWPTTANEMELHNHRYDFKSLVLAGCVKQDIYHVNNLSKKRLQDTDLEAVSVSCKPDTPDDGQVLGYATPEHTLFLETRAGGSYQIKTTDFHRAWSEGVTITELVREPVLLDFATVLHDPKDTRTCPFSVQKTTEECWARIEEMLSQAQKDGLKVV